MSDQEKLQEIERIVAGLRDELNGFVVDQMMRLRRDTQNDDPIIEALARRIPHVAHAMAINEIERILSLD